MYLKSGTDFIKLQVDINRLKIARKLRKKWSFSGRWTVTTSGGALWSLDSSCFLSFRTHSACNPVYQHCIFCAVQYLGKYIAQTFVLLSLFDIKIYLLHISIHSTFMPTEICSYSTIFISPPVM